MMLLPTTLWLSRASALLVYVMQSVHSHSLIHTRAKAVMSASSPSSSIPKQQGNPPDVAALLDDLQTSHARLQADAARTDNVSAVVSTTSTDSAVKSSHTHTHITSASHFKRRTTHPPYSKRTIATMGLASRVRQAEAEEAAARAAAAAAAATSSASVGSSSVPPPSSSSTSVSAPLPAYEPSAPQYPVGAPAVVTGNDMVERIATKLRSIVQQKKLAAFYDNAALERLIQRACAIDYDAIAAKWRIPKAMTYDFASLILYDVVLYIDDSADSLPLRRIRSTTLASGKLCVVIEFDTLQLWTNQFSTCA
jgi:hypothetical protein